MSNKYLLILGKSVLCVLSSSAIFYIASTFHEASHLAVAKALGVPVESIDWLRHVIIYGDVSKDSAIVVVDYVGGLATGVLLFGTLIVMRKWFRQSVYRWFFGMFIAAICLMQVCEGILEGAFHEAYIAGGWTRLVEFACSIAGGVAYIRFMRLPRELRNLRKSPEVKNV